MTDTANIVRKRGDTKRISISISDDTNAVLDVSGWTSFLLTVTSEKNPTDNTTQVAQLTGSFTTDGTNGKVYFVPTGTIPAGKYYYDIQAIDSNAEKTTILEGSYTIEQDRTKD